MVRAVANSLISVGLVCFLSLDKAEAQTQTQTSKKTPARGQTQTQTKVQTAKSLWSSTWGLHFYTFPQTVVLGASDGRRADVQAQFSGPVLTYELERKWSSNWSYAFQVGAAWASQRLTSSSTSIAYSYADEGQGMGLLGGGVQYATDASVKIGLGIRSFVYQNELPKPESPGVSYEFEYGGIAKNFLSLEMNWQLYSGWLLTQNMLMPLNPELGTGWQIGLKASF